MSFNHLRYDTCIYNERLNANVSYLSYTLDPSRYQHESPCRVELGLVGGNNVSQVQGNLVDLESNLFGIDRELSHCAQMKYIPLEARGKKRFKTQTFADINTRPKHLKHCQLFDYPKVHAPPPMDIERC